MTVATDDVNDLLELDRRRCAALADADPVGLARTLSDDYVHVHTNGRIDAREVYIAMATAVPKSVSREDVEVRVYGDAAVLVGAQISETDTRRLDMVVQHLAIRRDGEWRFVAAQTTPRAHD